MTEPAAPTPPSYKDTLNLPKTSFDMKANLTQREPEMVKRWAAENIYGKIRQQPHPLGKWILHDGPPYANGDIHMGHLINKVLKDIVVKFRTMQGHDAPYVPGWDCHGLPIESAIQKELGPKFRELSKDDVRKRCQEYAMKYVKLQGDSFQRLGIFGSFDKPYLTLDPKYEGGILDVLAELVQRDLVYRQKKPVHWCTNDRTALAEAELEYASKKDTSIFVNFEVTNGEKIWNSTFGHKPEKIHLMIWTTTPWTLPANRAVAVHPEHHYRLWRYIWNGDYQYSIFAATEDGELIPALNHTLGATFANAFKQWLHGDINREIALAGTQPRNPEPIGRAYTGRELTELGLTYRHPLDPSRVQPVVLANYVTLEDGTGLVHTAPGHGKEDYATGQRYGLETYNPVLPDGRYDDTVPEFLRGKTIWDANQLVIDKLKETGSLFHSQEFAHEYPHCWRCKKPVIFRATEQWFVKASGTPDGNPGLEQQSPQDASATHRAASAPATRSPGLPSGVQGGLWQTAKRFVNDVQWIPTWGKNRIDGMLDTRPDWCISRQRSWGVPIPAFFDEQGKTLLTEKSVRRIADHFRKHGADSWYTHTPAQLLELSPPPPRGGDNVHQQALEALGFPRDLNLETLTKGQDILDVWFESGASHHAVLECTHPELGYPANMYLEGSDQHRGWFQSSLLEASGYKSEPPFKQVLTHGFVVDENGKKLAKTSGNYVPVDKLLNQYGADVLRLWVSSIDYQNDIKFSANNITTTSEAYRKIRNTMRYLLGNLYDFNPQTDSVELGQHSVDAWMQTTFEARAGEILQAYDRYEFHSVFKLIYEFCNVEISAVYAKAIKDRLYCELPNSPKRRASQTVCHNALVRLIELSAPVLVFTAEEAWNELRKLPGSDSLPTSVHLREIPPAEGLLKVGINSFTKKQHEYKSRLHSAPTHWAVLLPLIEKGNKQLDDLKRSIGLGNPLDAEAVIIVPQVEDEVTKLIQEYGPEIEDALGVGFHRIEHGEIWDIKINDTRQLYPSCARSWKRRPDVGSDKDFPDLSARDAHVVRALRSKQ